MNDYNEYKNEKITTRFLHYLEELWPSIYKLLNEFLGNLWGFIKDTIGGLWRF